MRPRIGITLDLGTPDEECLTLELPADYATAIFRAGGMPILLPFTHDPDIRLEMLRSLDALLIPGGNDLDPKLYGQPLHPATNLALKERQDFDLALLALAETYQLPTLGICMGFQTMNILRRGTLHQHLPDLPRLGPDSPPLLAHRKPGDRTNFHDVTIHPHTRLAAALQLDRLPANSRHHQGLDRLGQGLVASAHSPDGLIEALEDPSLPFFLAVQWHPENLPDTPQDRLFQALVHAARAYRDNRNASLIDGH